MPQIRFVKNKPTLTVASGDNLMRSLLDGGMPVASSCTGSGICSKCRIKILQGGNNLSGETEHEKALRQRNNIGDDFRISCQTSVLGDITVDTGYW